MHISCPKCTTTYQLHPEAIPPEGRDVQCVNCNEIWFQTPVEDEPEESFPTESIDAAADEEDDEDRPQDDPPHINEDTLDPETANLLREEAALASERRKAEQSASDEDGQDAPDQTSDDPDGSDASEIESDVKSFVQPSRIKRIRPSQAIVRPGHSFEEEADNEASADAAGEDAPPPDDPEDSGFGGSEDEEPVKEDEDIAAARAPEDIQGATSDEGAEDARPADEIEGAESFDDAKTLDEEVDEKPELEEADEAPQVDEVEEKSSVEEKSKFAALSDGITDEGTLEDDDIAYDTEDTQSDGGIDQDEGLAFAEPGPPPMRGYDAQNYLDETAETDFHPRRRRRSLAELSSDSHDEDHAFPSDAPRSEFDAEYETSSEENERVEDLHFVRPSTQPSTDPYDDYSETFKDVDEEGMPFLKRDDRPHEQERAAPRSRPETLGFFFAIGALLFLGMIYWATPVISERIPILANAMGHYRDAVDGVLGHIQNLVVSIQNSGFLTSIFDRQSPSAGG